MRTDSKPIYGYSQYPHMGYSFRENPVMEISKIISENLTDWMSRTPALDTLKKLSAKSGVGFGTIQRAKNGEGNVTTDNLSAISAAFNRTPAELLTPRAAEMVDTPQPMPLKAIPGSAPPEAAVLWERYCAASGRAKAIVDAALELQRPGADSNDPVRSVVAGLLAMDSKPLADKHIMGPPYSVTTKGDLLIYVWVHANGMTGSSRSMALPFKDGKLNAAPNIPKEF